MAVKTFLENKINEEIKLYFAHLSDFEKSRIKSVIERWSNDELLSESHRFNKISNHLENPKGKKILDMSSGCGSFVIQGLKNGWDVCGIEPEDWKQELIDLKFKENSYPTEWRDRIHQGIGEKLPFKNQQFDFFDSWQTFEHVQNVQSCLDELYRVLNSKGKGIIHCPSYSTFFEGHYKLFWFPMMGNSVIGRTYLKLRKRPLEGLNTFVPINHRILISKSKKAGFKVQDIVKMEILAAAQRKFPFLKSSFFKWTLSILYSLWKLKRGIQQFGRQEKNIHILLTK